MANARIPFQRQHRFLKPDGLNQPDWKHVSELFQYDVPTDTQAQLHIANQLFASAGETNSIDNTVLATDLVSALRTFLSASRRLRRLTRKASIPENEQSLDEALTFYLGGNAEDNLRKMLPLQQLDAALALSSATADSVWVYLKNGSNRIATDLWFIWVALVTLHLKRCGITVGFGKEESANSPFIRFIEYSQSLLPLSCQTHNGYESIASAINRSRRSLDILSEEELMLILAGWGLWVLDKYPGLPSSPDAGKLRRITDALAQLKFAVENGPTG